MELVAPAGSLPALKAAVDQGADAVYIGFRNGANARNFPGLNFSPQEAEVAIRYAHERRVKVFCAINTHPDAMQWRTATDTVDHAARLGIDPSQVDIVHAAAAGLCSIFGIAASRSRWAS